MAVATKRLAGGSFNTTTVTPYTVPAGETAIIKYVTLHNPSAVATTTVTSRLVVGGSPRTWLVETLQPLEAKRFETWAVLMEGESISFLASLAANNVAYTVSGSELVGVAP